MIRQTQGILKKKKILPEQGPENFFFSPPKETTPREEKLHLIAITCGIGGRFFFPLLSALITGGVLQRWKHPGFHLSDRDGHFIVKKRRARDGAGARQQGYAKGTAAAAKPHPLPGAPAPAAAARGPRPGEGGERGFTLMLH